MDRRLMVSPAMDILELLQGRTDGLRECAFLPLLTDRRFPSERTGQ